MFPVKDNQPELYVRLRNFFKTYLTRFVIQHILYWKTLFTRTRLMKNHMGDLKQGVSKQAQVSMRILTGQE